MSKKNKEEINNNALSKMGLHSSSDENIEDVGVGDSCEVEVASQTFYDATIEESTFPEDINNSYQEVDTFQKESLHGVVDNCFKLNVRKNPDINSAIVSIINKSSKVIIDKDQSTNDWLKVIVDDSSTPIIEGYCMKKFINVFK